MIGSDDIAASFKETHHLPYTQTMIGAGPEGQTVVVQVDKSDPTVQERLWNDYKAANLYYAEEEHDGRIYLLGSALSQLKFLNSKHLPYTQTMIGEGPAGETVIVEVDKKNPALQQRLWSAFKEKHLYYAETSANGRT
ncbi:MAG: hypothetical protein AAF492_28845, partial [Verrucomicrobiota bacterium]